MNLRDLEYLVALAESRHFGRAAEACYVSQPTLSTQVRKLETELGVALVERTTRQVLLTAAGHEIVARAKTVVAGADEIRSIARRHTDPRSGSLRLGSIPTLAPYLLPHVVPALHDALPRLELLLTEDKTHVLVQALEAGTLDAAILATPAPDASYHSEPLFAEEFVLAAPDDHPLLSRSGPLHTTDLGDEPLLLLADGHCMRDQALDVCHAAGASERAGFRATSLETLRLMVAAGVGITLLPALAVQPPVAPTPGLTVRQFAEPRPYRQICLVWRSSSVVADVLTEVAAVLRTAIEELPAS